MTRDALVQFINNISISNMDSIRHPNGQFVNGDESNIRDYSEISRRIIFNHFKNKLIFLSRENHELFDTT